MLYKIAKFIVGILLRILYKIEVIGKENVPKNGAVIICSNHISNLDPPIVGITCPRDIHFMAKEELFENSFLRWLLQKLHAFPVKRGNQDRQALRNGIKVLKEGKVLGVFPEGTRSKSGELGKGLAGAGFFALRSDAAIVPCAIKGKYEKFKKLKVIYGKPIVLDKDIKRNAQEVVDLIMDEIQKLLDK
jgi:1-acyl-sn-glycerol-3-phosphate acyltransferase